MAKRGLIGRTPPCDGTQTFGGTMLGLEALPQASEYRVVVGRGAFVRHIRAAL